jgi:AraC-like DNA-binding protein
MRENHIRILCSVIKVDLVYEATDGTLTAFFDNVDESPLMQSANLRRILREGSAGQSAPFLWHNEQDCYFASIRTEDGILFMGPMAHQRLNATTRRQMYASYGIESEGLAVLPVHPLPEIRNMILLANTVLENASLENEELLQLNRIINREEQKAKRELTSFLLKEEEADDDAAYRHSYREEQLVLQAVREGRTADAIRLSESMDRDSGRLSSADIQHRRNLAIVGITLCSRAAIEAGVSPTSAYRISGHYIQKCDEARDPAHMLHYRNRAIEELTGRVQEKLNKPRSIGYVEKARDYVRKHYREKIYLEDVAEALSLSPTYLSRLFKKETGSCLQDFINEERVFRAANLLLYSELSLSEIATYVGFPNQSYMGKMFKKYRSMTPKTYRDTFRVPEVGD